MDCMIEPNWPLDEHPKHKPLPYPNLAPTTPKYPKPKTFPTTPEYTKPKLSPNTLNPNLSPTNHEYPKLTQTFALPPLNA